MPEFHNALVIVNPVSGLAQGMRTGQRLCKRLADRGIACSLRETRGEGDATLDRVEVGHVGVVVDDGRIVDVGEQPVKRDAGLGRVEGTEPLQEGDVAVVLALDAYPDRSFSGRITRVAPYVLDIEEHSRTFEIEAEFDDAEFAGALLPGTSADVEVILDSKQDVPRIPAYALIEGDRVLVLVEGELVSREVETGLKNWAFAEITAGLEVDESVVVSLDCAEVREGAQAVAAEETLR